MRRCVEASLPSSASFAFVVVWTEKGLDNDVLAGDGTKTNALLK